MLYWKPLKSAGALLGIAAVGLIATVASASPSSGNIETTNFVTANHDEPGHVNSDRVKFQTKNATDVRVQKLVFPAGAFTGWHHHPGIVIVAVQSGSLTLSQSDCSSKTYGPTSPHGAVFVEGHDSVQEARSTTGATVYVTYVAPSADPPVFRIEDPVPFCATSF